MSSSVDDLHPGFGPRDHILSPVTSSTRPLANFMRKRSYPTPRLGMQQQGANDVDHDTVPLSPGSSGTAGAYDAAHSHSSVSHQRATDTRRSPAQGHPTRPPRTRPALLQQLTQHSFTSRNTSRTIPQSTPAPQYAQTMEDSKLSFFQRHFTKPMDKDPEKEYKSDNRRFAFLSHGTLIAASIMLILLLGVVAAAVAVTLDHRRPPHIASPIHGPPVRFALDDNFPDPALWYDNGTYYAFATNNAAGILQAPKNHSSYEYGTSNVQIATSTDFMNWTLLNSSHDPLPKIGEWVTPGMTKVGPPIPKANVWAPGVLQRKLDNRFVMYYSARRRNASEPVGPKGGIHPPPHCIGAALSDGESPAGPYTPIKNTLACPIDKGGAIDPAGFQDKDGTLYVVYKVDGNNIGHGGICGNTKKPIVPTPIMLQKMEPDGLTAIGEPVQIMDRIAADGPLVEAPALIRSHEGIYFLFFSSGCTRTPSYDVKYATAKNVEGPYTRAGYPLLQTGDWGLLAPGSVGVHDDGNGGYSMAFHARVAAPQGRIRAMYTTKLEFDGNVVHMVPGNSTTT